MDAKQAVEFTMQFFAWLEVEGPVPQTGTHVGYWISLTPSVQRDFISRYVASKQGTTSD